MGFKFHLCLFLVLGVVYVSARLQPEMGQDQSEFTLKDKKDVETKEDMPAEEMNISPRDINAKRDIRRKI